ncbi:DUF6265 family protein [Yeosuana sp. MJ-SS3]|uniref:DUF6265 family protein n=1 Tax=Gilvirhabdus luticola TaxID=3079858 RepID=A0ABU3U9U4_9FLAO|nr:DUF6265 family protein [Yeosuana sp. MJ-SS3]MDU8887081.1 DUF6265 family protein [Yeosuana sp. MJ-SS3]
MKTIKLILNLLFFALSFNLCLAQQDLSQLEFLIGTWQVEGKQNFEYWEKVSETEFIGKGYKIRDGVTRISETLELKVNDNNITFIATVPDQNEGQSIPFTLSASLDNLWSFENQNHDFPKKIQYQLLEGGKIKVNVLGENDKGFSFYFIKQ